MNRVGNKHSIYLIIRFQVRALRMKHRKSNRAWWDVGVCSCDDKGTFIKAFACNLGGCSSSLTELYVVLHGIRFAELLGVIKVIVEVDSMDEHISTTLEWKEDCPNPCKPRHI